MSATNAHAPRDSSVHANNGYAMEVNPSLPHTDSDGVVGRFTNHAPDQGDAVEVDEFIAGVLRRAHRTAETLNAPSEARAILHVAHSFADELATSNSEFDRLRFIRAATGLS